MQSPKGKFTSKPREQERIETSIIIFLRFLPMNYIKSVFFTLKKWKGTERTRV